MAVLKGVVALLTRSDRLEGRDDAVSDLPAVIERGVDDGRRVDREERSVLMRPRSGLS